jgi:hypothetical protein
MRSGARDCVAAVVVVVVAVVVAVRVRAVPSLLLVPSETTAVAACRRWQDAWAVRVRARAAACLQTDVAAQ